MYKNNLLDYRFLKLSALFLLMVTGIFYSGCRKNTECTATITVVTSTGAPVSGASVRLYANISKGSYTNIEQIQTTDAGGAAVFVFKLQGIFDIDVTHSSSGTKTKLGVVKLEPGESVSKQVTY